jgi:hypothetical protein
MTPTLSAVSRRGAGGVGAVVVTTGNAVKAAAAVSCWEDALFDRIALGSAGSREPTIHPDHEE